MTIEEAIELKKFKEDWAKAKGYLNWQEVELAIIMGKVEYSAQLIIDYGKFMYAKAKLEKS